MKALIEKFRQLGLDSRFGYKVETVSGDICVFRHDGGEFWKNLVMNPPHPYLESEVIAILEHCAQGGIFKVTACCCMACKVAGQQVERAALTEFEKKYGVAVSHSFWPDHAAAEYKRFEV